jgi:hypothetical protein
MEMLDSPGQNTCLDLGLKFSPCHDVRILGRSTKHELIIKLNAHE